MSVSRGTLYLYSTPACHLCETALAVVRPFIAPLNITLEEIDISDSDELVDTYGTRIPVFRFSDQNRELDWPFTAEEFAGFAATAGYSPGG